MIHLQKVLLDFSVCNMLIFRLILRLVNTLGDKLGTKIYCPKEKKSKYKVCPSVFFTAIFFVPRKSSVLVMLFETQCKYTKV